MNKTAGSVRVFGYDIDKDIVNAKRQLGLVPQEFNFNPFETVLQIVVNQAGYYGVTRREAMARAEKYLNQLDLWGKRNERARMLSGGMKRRLMIARALMHQPKLLILDEPTAGVDIELRRSMWGFLKELNAQGTTIIPHYPLSGRGGDAVPQYRHHPERGAGGKHLDEGAAGQAEVGNLHPRFGGEEPVAEAGRLPQPPDGYLDAGSGSDARAGLNGLFTQLSAQGVQVLSMRNKANRLEELFVTLVNGNGEKA